MEHESNDSAKRQRQDPTANNNADLLGDGSFEMDIGSIVRTAIGESAVECERLRDCTVFAKTYACNVCSGVYPGDKNAALAHVEECCLLPQKANEKSLFCYVCWKLIGADNKVQHLSGADHNRVLAYREKNACNNIAYWITNTGATQVKPLKSTLENAVPFLEWNWADRLARTFQSLGSKDACRVDRIINQIKTAVQSGSGNKNAVSAKLGENSTLVAAIDALIACVTIGYMPCSTHAHPGNEHDVYDMLQACERFFASTAPDITKTMPSNIKCKGACKTDEKKYKQCQNDLAVFAHPGKLYLLLVNMRDTIVGKKE